MNMLQVAKDYLSAGLSIIPTIKDTKRPAIPRWKPYQTMKPTEKEITSWFSGNNGDSIAIITGQVSGNLELLDFDNKAELAKPWGKNIPKELKDRLIVERSQSGGLHVVYCCPDCKIPGNMKLAQRKTGDKIKTLIETRGHGGYFLSAPSPGYKLIQNDFTKIPIITSEEREILISAAAELNEYIDEKQIVDIPVKPVSRSGKLTPGDDYSNRGDVAALLQERGWTVTGRKGKTQDGTETIYLTRPGKTLRQGHSASLIDGRTLYVWSSNALPFEPGQAYSPFAVYAILNHGGNFVEAAKQLASYGYGKNPNDIQYDLSDCKQSKQSNNLKASVSICKQMKANVSNVSKNLSGEPMKTPHNLAANIKEFIINSRGSFTTRDIDTEFGLTTRKEKNARSVALYRYNENKLIKKDKRVAGKYHIINTEMEIVDLDMADEEPFPINLPFNLQNYVKIPKHSIIVLAGSSNAGKTALMLETLRLNLNQKHEKHYYMSEMAPGEYKSRLKKFDTPLSEWKKVFAACKSYDFEGAIESYNPDGLTCIDFLEEVDGEYFKIASSIREIYDALNNGVAMIAIQKKRSSETAYGGEATVQKARLYLVLDMLCAKEHSVVCALKIYKLKEPKGYKNLTNHEMHFELHHGTKMDVLMEWTPCNRVNRDRCISRYEMDSQGETFRTEDDGEIIFKTKSGNHVRIVSDDIQKWQERWQNMDVRKELEKIAKDSRERPFIPDKNWFFKLEGIMKKKSQEVPF